MDNDKNVDVYMSYSVKVEQVEGVNSIRTSTNVNRSLPNTPISDAKKAIVDFVNQVPDNATNIEVYFYETQDLTAAVAKY